MIVKPEKLKMIAEGLGYKARIVSATEDYDSYAAINDDKGYIIAGYNPLTNNDQMVEIMEKMKISVGWNQLYLLWNAQTMTFSKSEEGKTINEAVCNAAYEYFNQS